MSKLYLSLSLNERPIQSVFGPSDVLLLADIWKDSLVFCKKTFLIFYEKTLRRPWEYLSALPWERPFGFSFRRRFEPSIRLASAKGTFGHTMRRLFRLLSEDLSGALQTNSLAFCERNFWSFYKKTLLTSRTSTSGPSMRSLFRFSITTFFRPSVERYLWTFVWKLSLSLSLT